MAKTGLFAISVSICLFTKSVYEAAAPGYFEFTGLDCCPPSGRLRSKPSTWAATLKRRVPDKRLPLVDHSGRTPRSSVVPPSSLVLYGLTALMA